ncbi:MAG TPA: hypothetical protein ENK20_11415 [Chromatiales bacterium]|nr:hypothetical protein [Chromatiales bacterium]
MAAPRARTVQAGRAREARGLLRRKARPGAGAPCPACGRGRLVRRSLRDGRPFLGCTRFPRCRFFAWAPREAGR